MAKDPSAVNATKNAQSQSNTKIRLESAHGGYFDLGALPKGKTLEEFANSKAAIIAKEVYKHQVNFTTFEGNRSSSRITQSELKLTTGEESVSLDQISEFKNGGEYGDLFNPEIKLSTLRIKYDQPSRAEGFDPRTP